MLGVLEDLLPTMPRLREQRTRSGECAKTRANKNKQESFITFLSHQPCLEPITHRRGEMTSKARGVIRSIETATGESHAEQGFQPFTGHALQEEQKTTLLLVQPFIDRLDCETQRRRRPTGGALGIPDPCERPRQRPGRELRTH
jgi:hypothetical protein